MKAIRFAAAALLVLAFSIVFEARETKAPDEKLNILTGHRWSNI